MDYAVEVYSDGSYRWPQCEQDLVDAGVPCPLMHRSTWARTQQSQTRRFVATLDPSGKCVCGFAVEVGKSHALPTHRIMRVQRFGPALNDEARNAALYGLARFARTEPRILRVHLETLSRDEAVRQHTAAVLHSLGFVQVRDECARSYTQTVIVPLTPSEPDIFASLHATARRHIRAIEKHAVTLHAVDDPAYADRLRGLVQDTMTRTGGHYEDFDWSSIIEFSLRHPDLSRLVGLFASGTEGPTSLLAFAWGRNHGDNVEYAIAASTRDTNLKIPLGYGPAWDLICWGKRNGATWFDFGGITPGMHGGPDRLGGISDFKRYFSRNVVPVGAEWFLEPHPAQAKFARAVSAAASWVRRLG